MKTLFYQKNQNSTVVCSLPITIGSGEEMKKFDVSDEDFKLIVSGKHKLIPKNENYEIEKNIIEESEEIKQKKELKKKLNDGLATDEDIKNALKLLL